MFGIDAVHGHSNMLGAVIFPHNIGLGAARNAELVQRIAAITAEGVAATGIDWTFAPTLAVPQDVRWGRSYEGFSGDPALVREYAKAAIQGLQGPPELAGKLQAGRVAATGKSCLESVVAWKRRLWRARMSCSRISRSTRVLPTRKPRARSSSSIRGEP